MKRDDIPLPITFGSVCSGIEAVSVAVEPVGWEALWLAQFDPEHDYKLGPDFPSRVLAHHYPLVPNLGDMTKIAALVRSRTVAAPDVLLGGTPCQAFSIAGLRHSLDDARGQLTLSFVDLANAIDAARHVLGKPPAIILWENVPGVLSTKDNAFGCFLGALAGEVCELVAPGGKWPHAGCVYGPQRTVAWRVLDAQYFGVAQRRLRVFVVASAREGFDPTEVLFEFDGVRRDIAPSRETAEDLAGTVRASAARRGGVQDECGLGLQPVAFGGNNQSGPIDIATARNACGSGSGRLDFETETFLVHAISAPATRSVERPRGDGLGTLIAFDTTQITSPGNHSNPQPGDACHPLAARAHAPAIAFSCKDNGRDATVELAPTLRSMNSAASHQNGGGQMAVCVTGDITHTLKAESFDASEDGTGRGQPIVAVTPIDMRQASRGETMTNNRKDGSSGGAPGTGIGDAGDPSPTVSTSHTPAVHVGMAVRRLTPRECERLQSFPDFYTLIPIRKIKPARAERLQSIGDPVMLDADGAWWQMSADGPRYKALGNSMCVYNIRWLARRIQAGINGLPMPGVAHEAEIARVAA